MLILSVHISPANAKVDAGMFNFKYERIHLKKMHEIKCLGLYAKLKT